MQPVACSTVLRIFGDCHLDVAEVQGSGHMFSRHFSKPATSLIQDKAATALDTLAMAAEQLQPNLQRASLLDLEERRDSILAPNLQTLGACAQGSLAVEGHRSDPSATTTEVLGLSPLVQSHSYPPTQGLGLHMHPYGWHGDDSIGAWENGCKPWAHPSILSCPTSQCSE